MKTANIIQYLDRILRKSRLTPKDVDEIAQKINSEVFQELDKK